MQIRNLVKESQHSTSHRFVINLVKTEDGHIYNRASIQRWFDVWLNETISSMMNEPMGCKLALMLEHKDKIRNLIES